MEYNQKVKRIADFSINPEEKSEIVIKEMCHVIEDILNYNYAQNHYNSQNKNSTVLADHKNKIRNSLSILKSDLDIYCEMLGIREEVELKAQKRVERIHNKLVKM